MFIHKDKTKGRIMGQKVARNAEEAAEMVAGDLTSPIIDAYRCPICKEKVIGTRNILQHMNEKHQNNARAIFSINPTAYRDWAVPI